MCLSKRWILPCLFTLFFFRGEAQVSCGVDDKVLPEHILRSMHFAKQWAGERSLRKSAESTFFVCKIGVDIDAETYISHDRDSLLIHREVLRTLDIANPLL